MQVCDLTCPITVFLELEKTKAFRLIFLIATTDTLWEDTYKIKAETKALDYSFIVNMEYMVHYFDSETSVLS